MSEFAGLQMPAPAQRWEWHGVSSWDDKKGSDPAGDCTHLRIDYKTAQLRPANEVHDLCLNKTINIKTSKEGQGCRVLT